jgi:hypothetical protein
VQYEYSMSAVGVQYECSRSAEEYRRSAVSTVCAVHLGAGADLAVDGVVAFGGELGSVHLRVWCVWCVWCGWECMVWMVWMVSTGMSSVHTILLVYGQIHNQIHSQYKLSICSVYLFSLSVQSICSVYLFSLSVQSICSVYHLGGGADPHLGTLPLPLPLSSYLGGGADPHLSTYPYPYPYHLTLVGGQIHILVGSWPS